MLSLRRLKNIGHHAKKNGEEPNEEPENDAYGVDLLRNWGEYSPQRSGEESRKLRHQAIISVALLFHRRRPLFRGLGCREELLLRHE